MLIQRLIRAARLDINFYEEVEKDENLTMEAGIVVALASLAGGISALITSLMAGSTFGSALVGLIWGIVRQLIGWFIMSFLCYIIGTSLFKGTATYGELLRTMGYAYAPGLLRIFTFIPIIGWLLGLVVWIWTLVTAVIAVRQALDVDTGQAVVTSIIAWVANIVLWWILWLIFGTILGLGKFTFQALFS